MDAVFLTKLNTPKDIDAVQLIEEDMLIWTMMEIAKGILNTVHPRVQGMVAGTSDFVYELGCFSENGGVYLQTSLKTIILVKRSQDVFAIYRVSKRFKDEAGRRA